MPETDPKPRKVVLGEPLLPSELDRLTHFTQGDVETAKLRFRRDAARGFRDLLDSERVNEVEEQ